MGERHTRTESGLARELSADLHGIPFAFPRCTRCTWR
jgi:hypothetical protein